MITSTVSAATEILKEFFAPSGLDIDWNLSMPNSISDYLHFWIKDFDGEIAFGDNKIYIDALHLMGDCDEDTCQSVKNFAQSLECFFQEKGLNFSAKSNAEIQNGCCIGVSVTLSQI